jgi:hypothetical protein
MAASAKQRSSYGTAVSCVCASASYMVVCSLADGIVSRLLARIVGSPVVAEAPVLRLHSTPATPRLREAARLKPNLDRLIGVAELRVEQSRLC